MSYNREKISRESREAMKNSGVSYHAPDLSSVDYVPTKPFKAIHVNDEAGGDVTIVGIEGGEVTFTLSQGSWPYGGIKIVAATTTVTDLIAIF